MPYYVYILQSKKNNRYYIGSTSDVIVKNRRDDKLSEIRNDLNKFFLIDDLID